MKTSHLIALAQATATAVAPALADLQKSSVSFSSSQFSKTKPPSAHSASTPGQSAAPPPAGSAPRPTAAPRNAKESSQIFSPPNENSGTNPAPHLSPRQLHAVQLLLDGHTCIAVARALGVTPQTISRWKNQTPAFAAEVQRRYQALAQERFERERQRRQANATCLTAMHDPFGAAEKNHRRCNL